ncbi:MAG: hypothetical protein FJZ89_02900 [Chloroflexi bacterium]|nr:hypothetical protein [Chloroflexota bacterium]
MAEFSEGQLKVLEKLISDTDFRTSFFTDPDAALARVGFDLNTEELAGLKGLDFNLLGSALTELDARLSKTSLMGTAVFGAGVAGTGAAGTGLAGTGAAGTGLAGTGVAGTGLAGTGAAGTGSATEGLVGELANTLLSVFGQSTAE